LPNSLEGFNLPSGTMGLVYRPLPRITLDPRLVLVHDAGATQKLIEFPSLRDARGVVFCTGRFRVLTEEAMQKVLAADDALREKLGLSAVKAGNAEGDDDRNGTGTGA
jgi:hypothetical protein